MPGQYIVTFNRVADSLRAETESRERRQGFEAEHVYKRAVEGFSAELSPGQVTRLEADPEVAAGPPTARFGPWPTWSPGSPRRPRRQADRSGHHASARSGSEANGAVIDTGVDLDHPDLNASSGRNCVDASAPADDDNGHGTHVGGTIVAENDGSGGGRGAGNEGVRREGARRRWERDHPQVICGIDWVTSTPTTAIPPTTSPSPT